MLSFCIETKMMSLLLAVSVANMTITRDDANLRFKALIYSSEWLKDWLCPIVYGLPRNIDLYSKEILLI